MRNFIEDRVERITESGCWIWMRSTQKQGYGDFRLGKKHYLAHRASYESRNGTIPDGMHVLHICDVRSCCNPEHLFIGTNQDNIADSMRKGRRKGITRNRPTGLTYVFADGAKERLIEKKRKLKESDRVSVRAEYELGGISMRDLARKYCVSDTTIFHAVHRK